MKYDGERCIPGLKGLELLELEHRTRYALAAHYAGGKACLDLGSGSGYGAAALAASAAEVLGLDISQEAVDYAANLYGSNTLRFAQADLCSESLPAQVRAIHPDAFDCITCFEVIEHIEQPHRLLENVQALLSAEGVFLVSTPNINYPHDLDKVNPHHAFEYTREDIERVLGAHFRQVRIAQQTVHLLSAIGFETGDTITPAEWRDEEMRYTKYFVAVCSNREEPLPEPICALMTSDAHLKVVQAKLAELRKDQVAKSERLAALEQNAKLAREQLDLLKADKALLEILRRELTESLEMARRERQDVQAQLKRNFEPLHKNLKRVVDDVGLMRSDMTALKHHPAVAVLRRFSSFARRVLRPSGSTSKESRKKDGSNS